MSIRLRMANVLSREDWIDAALRMLLAQGAEAVKVEPVAKALGVTKGSFYWHFADRAALLAALLERWRRQATNAIIAEVEEAGGDAETKLRLLSAKAARIDGRLDNAIRAWAAFEPSVAAALAEIDSARAAYLEKLYREIGFGAREARARADFVYQALVGRFALSPDPLSTDQEEDRRTIIAALIARR